MNFLYSLCTDTLPYQGNVSQVVPHVSDALVRGQAEGPLKAGEGHVILLGIEATQAQVVEDLTVVDAHLKEAAV